MVPFAFVDVAPEQMIVKNVYMVCFSEHLQFEQGIFKRRVDYAFGAVIAIGDDERITGGKKTLGNMAKRSALNLKHY